MSEIELAGRGSNRVAGKVRVHELAKELGVTVKQLLPLIAEQGEFARSGSSILPAPVARRLREAHIEPPGKQTLGQPHAAPGPRPRPDPIGQAAGKPPYQFVRQAAKATTHHRDYFSDRLDRALCGVEDVAPLSSEESPAEVCTSCQDRLPRYEANWWRDRYLVTASELKQLRQRCAKLETQLRNRRDPAGAQRNSADNRAGQKSTKNVNAGRITQHCVGCKSQKLMTGFDIDRRLCAECQRQAGPHNVPRGRAQAKKAPPPPAGPKLWKCPNCLKRIQVDKKHTLVQHQNAKGLRCAGSGYQLPERSVDALDYRVAGSFEGGRR
jgi:hypothetical protein